MTYRRATVAVYDFDREKAGGLPKGGFLMAAKPEGDESFVLLRILQEARLPNSVPNDLTRQQGVESTSNDKPWPEALDPWMKDRVSLHGIECRILGSFVANTDGAYAKYAEDTDNYYAVSDLMVWKPDTQSLDTIVNFVGRKAAVLIEHPRTRIGATRFAAAEKSDATRAEVLLNPTDLLKRRTVYLGMSRSGKSNAMKITAAAVYRLRVDSSQLRIGQLIFDPNGEYAQDNPQDGRGLHRIHQELNRPRNGEVETYGLFKTPTDQERRIMKINFLGEQFPSSWTTDSVGAALEQLLAGRQIVQEVMAEEHARYTTSFRDADISVPQVEGDIGAQTRYRRSILAYQTALAAAGLTPPSWTPSVTGLFSAKLLEALRHDDNEKSDHRMAYLQAATILEHSKKANGTATWSSLETLFRSLDQFIRDKKSYYEKFDSEYIQKSTSGESWAEPRLRSLLRIFESQNGPRSFQRVGVQHDPSSDVDFAESVVKDLQDGKLVIVDQSTGDPEQNRAAAERIMWKVFRAQQDAFVNAAGAGDSHAAGGHILVYVEEAHNLLPRAHAADNLRTVWARGAKEGSKMNIGMVLATQAPSSIMPEILSETDNWILAYLNSESERRVISGYMDFEDFLEQIGQVSEPGFVRLRTLSRAYTVPVQFDRFLLSVDEDGTSA